MGVGGPILIRPGQYVRAFGETMAGAERREAKTKGSRTMLDIHHRSFLFGTMDVHSPARGRRLGCPPRKRARCCETSRTIARADAPAASRRSRAAHQTIVVPHHPPSLTCLRTINGAQRTPAYTRPLISTPPCRQTPVHAQAAVAGHNSPFINRVHRTSTDPLARPRDTVCAHGRWRRRTDGQARMDRVFECVHSWGCVCISEAECSARDLHVLCVRRSPSGLVCTAVRRCALVGESASTPIDLRRRRICRALDGPSSVL